MSRKNIEIFILSAAVALTGSLSGCGRALSTAGTEAGSSPGQQAQAGLIFFGVLTLAVGLCSIIYPQFFWWLRIGRRAPHVAPIRAYLNLIRAGGVLVCILALLILYSA